MDIEQARKFIKEQNWIFAKTYAKTLPHEYIVRNTENSKQFEQFLTLIREKGEVRVFGNQELIYFELDNKKYWEMGRPKCIAKIINRDDIKQNKWLKKAEEGTKEKLLRKMKFVEDYIKKQQNKEKLTEDEQKELKFLLNTTRKSKNRLNSSKKTIKLINEEML